MDRLADDTEAHPAAHDFESLRVLIERRIADNPHAGLSMLRVLEQAAAGAERLVTHFKNSYNMTLQDIRQLLDLFKDQISELKRRCSEIDKEKLEAESLATVRDVCAMLKAAMHTAGLSTEEVAFFTVSADGITPVTFNNGDGSNVVFEDPN